MPGRVAEDVVGQVRVRVDLHGVSVVDLDGDRRVMRWEWIESITADEAVTVAGGGRTVAVPPGAFGLHADELAERLRTAGSIVHRTDVIAELQAAVDQA